MFYINALISLIGANLKIYGFVDWSWKIILSPIWITFSLYIIISILIILFKEEE